MIAVMPDVSFLNLLERCKNGDPKAQKEIYKDHFGLGMAVCQRYCKSREEALEIYNNAWLKVFNNLHTYKPTHSFQSWFKRILINASIDYFRKNQKHYYHSDLESAYQVGSNGNSPDANLLEDDLMEILQSLPENYRINFTLFAIEGYPHQEIAKMLNISEGTSKSNVSRARDLLRQKLAHLNVHYK